MSYNEQIELDLSTDNSWKIIGVKQYDTGRIIEAIINKNGEAYSVYGASVSYRIKQPNGNYVWKMAEVNIDSPNIVNIHLNDEDVSSIGNNVADIVIITADGIESTASFIIEVQPSPTNIKRVAESDSFQYFVDAVEEYREIVEDAQAWAVGSRGAEAVPSDDKTYENNSKYYAAVANNAKDSAESALIAAESARDNAISAREVASISASIATSAAASAVGAANAVPQKIYDAFTGDVPSGFHNSLVAAMSQMAINGSTGNLIAVQSGQPSAVENILWINPYSEEEIEVPTMEDMLQYVDLSSNNVVTGDYNIEIGGINSTGDNSPTSSTAATTRLRTDYIPLSSEVKIKILDPQYSIMNVFTYSKSGNTYTYQRSWSENAGTLNLRSSEFIIHDIEENETFFRVSFYYTENTSHTMTDTDVATLKSNLSISTPTDRTLQKSNVAADAKAVGEVIGKVIGIPQKITFTDGGLIDAVDGTLINSSVVSYSDYIPIPFGTKYIAYSNQNGGISDNSIGGMAFYKKVGDSYNYLGGNPRQPYANQGVGYNDALIYVPEETTHARFSNYIKSTRETYNLPDFYICAYNDFTTEKFEIANKTIALRAYSDCILKSSDGYVYEISSNQNYIVTRYYNIKGIKKLAYTRMIFKKSVPDCGMAFYDADYIYISGETSKLDVSLSEPFYEIKTIDVPDNAVYVRFTWWSQALIDSYDGHITEKCGFWDASNYETKLSTSRLKLLEHEIEKGGALTPIVEECLKLGIHHQAINQGQLNLIKRCRQMTDIKWTPAIDLPRLNLVTTSAGYGTGKFYVDNIYKAGIEYMGIPYSRSNVTPNYYGRPKGSVGVYVDFEQFVTSVCNKKSRLCEDAARYFTNPDTGASETRIVNIQDQSEGHSPLIYGAVCSDFVSYALGLSQTLGTLSLARYNDLTEIGKLDETDDNYVTATDLQIGDVLIDISKSDANSNIYDSAVTYERGDTAIYSGKCYECIAESTTGTWNSDDWQSINPTHTLIITDIIEDANNVTYIEISEETSSGNGNESIKSSHQGGGARRVAHEINYFYQAYSRYYVYRYKSSKLSSITYKESNFIPVGSDPVAFHINDYPCMPYEGNNYIYKQADEYDSSTTYSSGDYVYYENQLYQSKAYGNKGHTPRQGSSYWVQTVGIGRIVINYEPIYLMIKPVPSENPSSNHWYVKPIFEYRNADVYNKNSTYSVGDYCKYEDNIYRCTTLINTAEVWDPTHWHRVTDDEYILTTDTDVISSSIYYKKIKFDKMVILKDNEPINKGDPTLTESGYDSHGAISIINNDEIVDYIDPPIRKGVGTYNAYLIDTENGSWSDDESSDAVFDGHRSCACTWYIKDNI